MIEVTGTSLSVSRSLEAGEAVPLETLKMLKLAEQCLERAQSTAAKLGGRQQQVFLGRLPESASSVGCGPCADLCALQGKPA